jgi:aspartate/glutamate racemase
MFIPYLKIIQSMVAAGCEGVIFGCTEIPLLLTQKIYRFPALTPPKFTRKLAFAF